MKEYIDIRVDHNNDEEDDEDEFNNDEDNECIWAFEVNPEDSNYI